MTARSRAAATASLLGAVWGCGANSEPRAPLIAVSPPMAYNNVASTLLLEGGPFRPAYRFDTQSATSSTDVGAFSARLVPARGDAGAQTAPISIDPVSWLSVAALTATLPPGVPPGTYDVDLQDPRGEHTVLSGAFLSLGSDEQPPVVTILSPVVGSLIGAQTTVWVTLSADDGAGQIASLGATVSVMDTSTTGSCTVPPASQSTVCHFSFTAPTPAADDDMVTVYAEAIDSAGNPGYANASFRLALPPSLASNVVPNVGPAAGGTAIDLVGSHFVQPIDDPASDGSKLLIDGVPIDPSLVVVVSDTEITAILPPHEAGTSAITVANGDATTTATYFEFVAAPIVKMISPAHGPLSGGTAVAVVGDHFRNGATQIFIGASALAYPHFVSANRIEGVVPPGADSGWATVQAYDPIGGMGTLLDAFMYDPVASETPDGGVDPMNDGGAP
jgi:hypothetical protein